MKSTDLNVPGMKVGVIINTSSGGCDSESEAEMLDVLRCAGVTNYTMWCGESHQIKGAFEQVARHKPDVLVVLGGDGTIRSAAKACSGTRTYLVPLPGGTLNMLPRALYGCVSWQDALRSILAAPVTGTLSGGRVGDELFFVAAVLGAPALWMEARESIRERKIVNAAEKSAAALQAMFNQKIRYSISSETRGEAEILAIVCPLVSKEMSGAEQALEAAAVDVENAAQLLGLATAAAFGKWREDKSVRLTKASHISVQSSSDIPVFLDGERVSVGERAEISFVSNAVNVAVPTSEHREGILTSR